MSFCSPLWAITKLVSNSLIGVCDFTGKPSFCAAHCSHKCFSIFLPCLISVRWTVAGLLQLSHFIRLSQGTDGARSTESYFARPIPSITDPKRPRTLWPVDRGILRSLPHLDSQQSNRFREANRVGDVLRHVFRRWIRLLERFELVQVPVVHRHNHRVGAALELVEIHHRADRIELGRPDHDLHDP